MLNLPTKLNYYQNNSGTVFAVDSRDNSNYPFPMLLNKNTDNRFVFLIPCFNGTKTLEQMLISIIYQTYDNWFVMIRDDMSTDGSFEFIQSIIKRHNVEHKFKVVKNETKLWEVENVLSMIKDENVKDKDILVRMDFDDFLSDLNALSIINQYYVAYECDTLWTDHRWNTAVGHENFVITDFNISADIPPGSDIFKFPWVSSHLKTFRKYLLNNVKDENYRGPDGQYAKRTGDQYIYKMALYNSKKRIHVPIKMYHYSIDLFDQQLYQKEDSQYQAYEAKFLNERGYIK